MLPSFHDMSYAVKSYRLRYGVTLWYPLDCQSGTGTAVHKIIGGWHVEHDQEATAARAVPAPDTVPDLARGTREPLNVRPKEVPPPAPPTGAGPERRSLVPDINISDTGEMVRGWVRSALVSVGSGRWHYDASLAMVPDVRRQAMTSVYAIVIYAPSPILGQKPTGVVQLVDDFPSKDDVTKAVRTAVAKLRDVQSSALRQPVNLSELRRH